MVMMYGESEGAKKNLNIKKIIFKVVKMKFLAMHITNQKLSSDILKVGNLLNIFMVVMITYNIYIVIRETGQFSSKGIINDFIGNLNRLTVSRRFTEQAV